MQVRRLDITHPRDVHQFIRFPFELYRNCEQWVPPLIPDMKQALNIKYPFYQHSDADFFLAESEGQTLGRIAVLENRPYNQFHSSKATFFYYFEVVKDIQVARALFDAAFDWTRKRGLDTVLGPKGLLRGDGQGLLVEGFEHRPAIGIAYNFDYYDAFVKDAGFDKELDYFSGHLRGDHELSQRLYDIAEKVKARRGFWIKSFSRKKELRQLAPVLHKIYQQAFVQVWGYYPVREDEIAALIGRIASIADPRLIKVVMREDEPIGFVIAYPDVSAAIQSIKGSIWTLGWISLLLEANRTKWVNLNGVGILPKYQGSGANAVLYTELFKTFKTDAFHFEHGDLVQVAENTALSLGDMTALGVEWYKRHRIYRKTL
jgi:hypothetical protein